ncbi:MAG: CBS domain-containing protein [Acidimicrobiales bacterium]
MNPSASIAEVMTTDPVTIDRSDPISEAYRLLRDAPFHHLPVLDGDEPVGMVATSDILRLVYDVDGVDDRALRTYIDHQFTMDDAMSVDLRTLAPDATVRDAAAALADGSIHSVLVMDGGKIAGIVTTTDLARWLSA